MGWILNVGSNNAALALCGSGEFEKIFGGIASWYGGKFHGRKTASGSTYDMNKLTCAHKTLPFGTKLLVFNPQNGRQVQVVVTDRGPYVGQRVIDLSKAAADKLCISGIGNVVCYAGKKFLGEIAETMHITKAKAPLAVTKERATKQSDLKPAEVKNIDRVKFDSIDSAEAAYQLHNQLPEPMEPVPVAEAISPPRANEVTVAPADAFSSPDDDARLIL